MTDHTATEPPPLPLAVGAQVQRGVRPCAYRLRDTEAQSWLYYSDDELHAAAKATLDPLYDRATLDEAMDAALKLWPRDCRLCAHFRDGLTHAAHCVSVLRCEDSSAYRATQPVQFWEKRPQEPALF